MSIQKKKELIKEKIIAEHGLGTKSTKINMLIDKMAESNIPVGYWFLTMDKFSGSPKLRDIVEDYTSNLDAYYMQGKSIGFAGNQGTGKTMSSICILKSALKKNYSAYYTAAVDLLSDLSSDEAYRTRKIVRESDFLVVDELDSRFFGSDNMKQFFGGRFESVFRHRMHNELPTIICTNETEDILNVFNGAAVQSIGSLMNQYVTIYPVVGKDFRKGLVDGK